MKIKKISFFVVALFFLDILTSVMWFKWIENHEQTIKGDGAQIGVLLMGNFNRDYTDLGDETLRRVRHAAEVFQKGMVDYIYCVGGARPKKNVYGAQMMAEHLQKLHVPLDRIIIDIKSFDSISNWKEASHLIKQYQWQTVLILSSPLHCHRFRQVVKNAAVPDLDVTYYPYSYQQPAFKLSFISMLKQVHYEWIAYLSKFVPTSIYNRFIKANRAQVVME